MKKNMGFADRIIRIIAAIAFIILYFTGVMTGTIGIIILAIAAMFIITAALSICPLYSPFGINTGSIKDDKT